jgi:quercetin dioxygenase-like cupin family protein
MNSFIVRSHEKRKVLRKVHGGYGTVILARLFEGVTQSPITVFELTMERGSKVGAHVHIGSEEILYVIKGKARVTINNTDYILEEGDAALTRSGFKHSFQNVGDSELRLIIVSSTTNILKHVFNIILYPILDKFQDRNAVKQKYYKTKNLHVKSE